MGFIPARLGSPTFNTLGILRCTSFPVARRFRKLEARRYGRLRIGDCLPIATRRREIGLQRLKPVEGRVVAARLKPCPDVCAGRAAGLKPSAYIFCHRLSRVDTRTAAEKRVASASR